MVDSNDTTDDGTSNTNSGCDACGERHASAYETVHLADAEYRLCDGCVHFHTECIDNWYWFDRITDERYSAAAAYLRSLDEVWCVKDHGRPAGEMWVHTPYCDSTIVADVCDHFDCIITGFGIVHPDEHEFDCVHDHGPCVEILIEWRDHWVEPLPSEADYMLDAYSDIEWLDERTRLFGDDDE